MEDGSPFDIWSWELSTRPWPRLNCQNILFWSDGPSYCVLSAAALRSWFSSVMFFDLEECWVKLAQLFTFYWDLTRNKFSFPLNAFLTRSPSLIKFLLGRHLGIVEKTDWNHLEYRSRFRITNSEDGRTANPRGRFHPPYHLRLRRWYSGTLQKLVVISNVKLKGKWILLSWILNWPHHTPHCSATSGRIGPP